MIAGIMVPRAGVEPARTFGPRDFKSLASTCFATWAFNLKALKAEAGIEPAYTALQAAASPLCHPAKKKATTY